MAGTRHMLTALRDTARSALLQNSVHCGSQGNFLEAEIAQAGVFVWQATERPVKFPARFGDRVLVDAGDTTRQAFNSVGGAPSTNVGVVRSSFRYDPFQSALTKVAPGHHPANGRHRCGGAHERLSPCLSPTRAERMQTSRSSSSNGLLR